MNFSNTQTFITEDFLLQSELAKRLYYDFAAKMPIIDYHNHLSPRQLAENKSMQNLTEAWLEGDHYKWRAMRAQGVEEKFITGKANDLAKFEKWAETVPFTVGNPLFHWTHLELLRYFDIHKLLQPNTASEIYHQANSVLQSKTPRSLLEEMNVEVLCTTDDPADHLQHHKALAANYRQIKIFPTFRSDALFGIDQPEYLDYLQKLSEVSNNSLDSLDEFLEVIAHRIDYFHQHGCRLSDYGLGEPLEMVDAGFEEVSKIFTHRKQHKALSRDEVLKFKSFLFLFLAKKYNEKGWVQQYHLGAIRNNNQRLLEQVGLDVGCDSISDFNFAQGLSKLFGALDLEDKLAKTITYNLNPSHNEVFATMMGNFNRAPHKSKMQWGSGWWYLDQKNGIENQLTTLSNMGLLSGFVGMLTDSRSLLSFTRHEYFRRILCNFFANQILEGLLPNDLNFFGKLVEQISYNNAKSYFNFEG